MPSDGEFCAWIRALRDRLDRGELAEHPPVDVGYGTRAMPAERTIRIMLADLDSFEAVPAGHRERAEHVRRQLGACTGTRR